MPEEKCYLPSGWEAKIDNKTGKTYYINHHDKTTSWDHPCNPKKQNFRMNAYPKAAGTEYISLQHGSPDFKRNYVYPSQFSPIPAFQVSPHESPKINLLQDFSSRTKGSPLTVRSKTQESSVSSNSVNTDEAVSKIAAMFPTVSDAHIRLLMKKFHNREVLVISALQVEKNPITTPGPFATPPLNRAASGANSYTNSPRIGDYFRSSPRPHPSPKLKLSCRYMKTIFPKAEETLILEILSNHDNDIQKSSEKLKEMGFEKKDSLKISQQKQDAQIKIKEDKVDSPAPVLKMKTPEEKENVKSELRNEYPNIPEQLITMALESVDFDKEKASNLLRGTSLEKSKSEETKVVEFYEVEKPDDNRVESSIPVSMSRQSLKSLLRTERTEIETIKNYRSETDGSGYRSSNLSNVLGPNPALAKGNKENLLLEDYVKWLGPDPNLRRGADPALAKGPNASYQKERRANASGPNSGNRKGPNRSLVKGSIFNQMKSGDGLSGESRGK